MNNRISLRAIYDLLDNDFLVPAYHRGYRWTRRQVEDLLNDIHSFAVKNDKEDGEFYCLQPIVVKEKTWKERGAGKDASVTGWELIDGQQRLTTIRLLVRYLEKEHLNGRSLKSEYGKQVYRLHTETKGDIEPFIENIDEKNEETIDFYHMAQAYRFIREWFQDEGRTRTDKEAILNTLVHRYGERKNPSRGVVQVIWFEIRDNTDAIATFIRINMGKIQLTNSELVKALFLQERNFGDNDEVARIRQLEIAGEWNSMENSLQDENLWWFLNREENPLPARIEFVLDLIREIDVMHDPRLPQKIGDDRFSTFRYFFQRIGESDDYEVIRNEWKRIKDYHNRILEFYENPEWYHYIGFLIHCGKEVPELLDAILSCKTKDEITEKLETMIKEKFAGLDVNRNGGGSLIIDLSYPDDRRKIREILLLFNLEYIVKQCKEKRAIQKFPFQAFAEQKWDIEHIDSATANPLKDRAAQEEWMKAAKEDVPEIAGDKKLSKRIEAFLGNKKSTEACDFEQIQADIIKLSGEDETSQDKKNSLGNLVLLDSGMNRSYRNALFPTKRRMIIEKDMRGAFIPICTKNTFLKYFDTDGTRSSTNWNEDDIEQYSAFITKTLERFLPVKGKKK